MSVCQSIRALCTARSIGNECLQSDTISKGSVCINEEKRGPREGNPHTVSACQLKILKGPETGLFLLGECCSATQRTSVVRRNSTAQAFWTLQCYLIKRDFFY